MNFWSGLRVGTLDRINVDLLEAMQVKLFDLIESVGRIGKERQLRGL